MLKDYPNLLFSPEEPELDINLKTGMKIKITKFVINNDDLDFLSDHSLGFQVQEGKKIHLEKKFVSLVSASQKDPHVVEPNITLDVQQPGKVKIKIVGGEKIQNYSISMLN